MSSQSFASELIANLVSLGVRNFYLSPGSRSQALALAANSMEQIGEAQVTVRIDERAMAFTALGAAMASEAPVCLITTSGTAVANLHPAVLEAHHSGIPLILLTADRPKSLRNKGANQTTNQVGIFGDAVRLCVDADESFDAAALARQAIQSALSKSGPVQLNLQFVEPLSDTEPTASEIFQTLEPKPLTVEVLSKNTLRIALENSSVVIAGAGATAAAAEFAESYNLPLFAEPSSQSRHSRNAIHRYAELLNTELAKKIDQVIVFGKPTLNRSVTSLIKNCAHVQIVKNIKFGVFDIGNNAENFADSYAFEEAAEDSWIQLWQAAQQELDEPGEFSRGTIVRAIWAASSELDAIFLGASKLVREADRFAPGGEQRVFSNRGLAGIDGTTSTALGIAQQTLGTTRVLMGDLTVLHDIGGLNLTGLGSPNIHLIVVNDRGGKIFDQLEVKKTTDEYSFEKLFKTPQEFDLKMISEGFGWNHIYVKGDAELSKALETSGPVVIEISLD